MTTGANELLVALPQSVLLVRRLIYQARSITLHSDRHIPILLKLAVVTLRLLRDTVSEEAPRQTRVLVFNREDLVESSKSAKLV